MSSEASCGGGSVPHPRRGWGTRGGGSVPYPRRGWGTHAFVYVAVAAVAVGAFARTLGYPFVYDDRHVIEQNPVVTEPGGWSVALRAPFWPPDKSFDPLYRPLTTLSFKINYAIGGGRAVGFRAGNLVLHAVTAMLVAVFARRLWGRDSAAWVAGMLFVVHPIHAETLGLVVGRAELLATLFVTWMLSRHLTHCGWCSGADPSPKRERGGARPVVCALAPDQAQGIDPSPTRQRGGVPPVASAPGSDQARLADPSSKRQRGAAPPVTCAPGSDLARPSVRYHLGTTVLFLLALGSKEHAVIAWPAIVLVDLLSRQRSPFREPWRPFLRRIVASHHLGLILALALFFFMRWVIFGNRTTLPADLVNPFANPLIGGSAVIKLATPFGLLWLAVRQWFLAAPLCPIWSVGGFDLPSTLWRADVLAGLGAAVAVVVLLAMGPRRVGRCWLMAGLFGLAVLLPCHFVPAANWLYAERWMYLPGVFLSVLCAGLTLWAPRFSVAASTAAAALLVATTLPYSGCWRTHEGLFEAVVARQPYSFHGLLGLVTVRERAGRLTECAAQVERLTERFPESERAWYYRMVLAAELEDWKSAAEALEKWGTLWPPQPPPPEIAEVVERIEAHRE